MQEKKSTFSKAFGFILGLLLLGGILYGTYFLLAGAVDVFLKIDKQVALGVVAASGTIIVSVATIVLTKYYEKKKQIEADLREKKIAVYQDFISLLFKVLLNEIDVNDPKVLNRAFMDFTEKLIVWGSDKIVEKYSSYRKEPNRMVLLEEILFEIRKDLGHKNKNLVSPAILRLFVNDIDQHPDKLL